MKATDELKKEHEGIKLMLRVLQAVAGKVNLGDRVNPEHIDGILEFLSIFVDKCHHAKEEKHLFAAMHAHGMPMTSGPLAVMLREHEQGRAHVRAIAEAAGRTGIPTAASARKVKNELSAYAALLRGHIDKEDKVLYPMADSLLTADEQNALTQAFERVESEEIGAGVHERYHAWIETLAQEQALSASGDGSQSGETQPAERKER